MGAESAFKIILIAKKSEPNGSLTLRFLFEGREGDESGASASDVSCSCISLRRARRRFDRGIAVRYRLLICCGVVDRANVNKYGSQD